MHKKEFKLRVQALAVPTDFKKNESILDQVDELHREIYLNCLKLGTDMRPSVQIASIIWDITRETALSDGDIFHLLPTFRKLLMLIEANNQPIG